MYITKSVKNRLDPRPKKCRFWSIFPSRIFRLWEIVYDLTSREKFPQTRTFFCAKKTRDLGLFIQRKTAKFFKSDDG